MTIRQQVWYNQKMDIHQALKDIGFGTEEIATYLAMLDSGPATGAEIAKAMNLKRPTVYGYLDRLIDGGLASQSLRGGVKIFAPEAPDKIRALYRRRIESLRKNEKALEQIVPALNKRGGKARTRPCMQFFEGRAGIESALQDFLSYPGVTMRTFFPLKSIIDTTSEDFFDYFNLERIRLNIWIKGIWPHNHTIDTRRFPGMGVHPALKRESRRAPPGFEADMAYRIYANKVLFTASRAENYCFIVESPEFAKVMTVQHDALWQISTPMKTDAAQAEKYVRTMMREDGD